MEIRAHHLDRAVLLREELEGRAPDELRIAAATALEGAGRRALTREAFRTARSLLAAFAPSWSRTLRRRYLAAHAAWRLLDMQTVSEEMDSVAADAEAAGEHRLQGRALTALGEMALYQRADADEAQRLIEKAGEVLSDDDDVDARFDVYSGREHDRLVARRPRARSSESAARRSSSSASAGRKDLEAIVIQAVAQNAIITLDVEEAEIARPCQATRAGAGERQRPRPRRRARDAGVAERDPGPVGRRRALLSRADPAVLRHRQRHRRRLGADVPRPAARRERARRRVGGDPARVGADAQARRRPRAPLRGAALPRADSRVARQGGRGRAARAAGDRDRRARGSALDLDDADGARRRARPRRGATPRPSSCSRTPSRRSRGNGMRYAELQALEQLTKFLRRPRPERRGAGAGRARARRSRPSIAA